MSTEKDLHIGTLLGFFETVWEMNGKEQSKVIQNHGNIKWDSNVPGIKY